MIYTGIGARKTPSHILDMMEQISSRMAQEGHTLRSGGASGADTAFETGCDIFHGDKEIYLPWEGFNGSPSQLFHLNKQAYSLAEKYHPVWDRLSQASKKFMARNSYQVLGADLHTPSNAVICWTPEGKITGGTGQAIRMANAFGIPVINLASINQNMLENQLARFFEIKRIELPQIVTKAR